MENLEQRVGSRGKTYIDTFVDSRLKNVNPSFSVYIDKGLISVEESGWILLDWRQN